MSTFSTRGGLYERAQKRFAVQDGKKLFTFAFFEKQRLEAMVGTACHATPFNAELCYSPRNGITGFWQSATYCGRRSSWSTECRAALKLMRVGICLCFVSCLV